MDVRYSPEITEKSEGVALLRQASKLVADVLKPATQVVKVEWSVSPYEPGTTRYRLTLADPNGEASSDLTLQELRDPSLVRYCVSSLWGDILKIRQDIQHLMTQEALREFYAEMAEAS